MKCGNQKAISEIKKEDLATQTNIEIGQDDNGVVENNDITDISCLMECSMLEILRIVHTKITELPLSKAVSLKQINIEECKNLQTLNGLECCLKLKEMCIEWLEITSIAAIGKLQSLTKITICGCKQIADYDVFTNCTNLTYLRLGHTNISNIHPIVNLQTLETLGLKDNDQLPKKYQKYINGKQEVQQFLNLCTETQQLGNAQKNKPTKKLAVVQQKEISLQNPKQQTFGEQINQLQKQLQDEEQQSQHDISIQNEQIQQMKIKMDQYIQQTNEQNLNIQEQLQQQSYGMNYQMQQLMQQMIQQNNQLSQQISLIQIKQDQKYTQMNKALQQITEKQMNETQNDIKHLTDFVKIFDNNQ